MWSLGAQSRGHGMRFPFVRGCRDAALRSRKYGKRTSEAGKLFAFDSCNFTISTSGAFCYLLKSEGFSDTLIKCKKK